MARINIAETEKIKKVRVLNVLLLREKYQSMTQKRALVLGKETYLEWIMLQVECLALVH